MSELVRGTGTTPLGGLGGAMVGWRVARRGRPGVGGGVTNRVFALLIMSDGDDSAGLWKVNRTIHELVKDRVLQSFP
jgi:hypothetical protein